MTRTPTKPPTDVGMQRKAKRLAHPDAGGDHEFFIWITDVIERACSAFENASMPPSSRPEPAKSADLDRVPFSPTANFASLTRQALKLADDVVPPYRSVLRLLEDCEPLAGFENKQQRGASYRQLAAIGHLAGMGKSERVRWYRVAESVPLSDRHAGHLLGKLKRQAA